MPPTTTNSATGLFLQKHLAEHEHRQRADRRCASDAGLVSCRCLRKWPHALPEIAVRAVDAEQLGQLRAGEEQRHAALEPDHARSRR